MSSNMSEGYTPPPERIEKFRVPDEDVPNWMQTLHESGFSTEEIDAMMRHLNDEYASQKLRSFIELEVETIDRLMRTKRGKAMSDQEKGAARKLVLERLRDVDLRNF